MNNEIIKFVFRKQCRKLFSDQHYLMGFYRKTPDYVIACSIVREEKGFEYTCICNYATYCSPDNCFQTFDECYSAMMKELKSLSCNREPGVGHEIVNVTEHHVELWDFLEIEGEYPLEAVLKSWTPQIINTDKGRKAYCTVSSEGQIRNIRISLDS